MFALADDFVNSLPGDPVTDNRTRQVLGACYSFVQPTPVCDPKLLAWSEAVASHLGLTKDDLESPSWTQALGGNALIPGSKPYAACYGGHQFGHWAGQLGDGRAITLGECQGRDGQRWELQLKGAGPTPYSRRADGRAVLRSSLREFLCSEAMHHLGVPTTRALSLVTTGEGVDRDMFYDGNPREEPGAVVCRVAPSFVRFGNFELPASRNDVATLEALVKYTLERFYPDLGAPSPASLAAFFAEVAQRTAVMVAHWMRVGFVHGVMNTDNMSILGLTIDYGPYGFLDAFEPRWTPNTTDLPGRRYCYENQPKIALWNLAMLGNALLSLGPSVESLEEGLGVYRRVYDASYRVMMGYKLGLPSLQGEDDDQLLAELLSVLQSTETDMTIFFRRLDRVAVATSDVAEDSALVQVFADAFYNPDEALSAPHAGRLAAWLRRWSQRVARDGAPEAERLQRLRAANPVYIPRNYMAQLAIDAAEQGDCGPLLELLRVVQEPYTEQEGMAKWAEKRPDWARHRAGCSALSCSS